MRPKISIVVLALLLPPALHATGTETGTVLPVDPAGCMAAIAANDDDKVTADCGALIDNEKTEKADRIKNGRQRRPMPSPQGGG